MPLGQWSHFFCVTLTAYERFPHSLLKSKSIEMKPMSALEQTGGADRWENEKALNQAEK